MNLVEYRLTNMLALQRALQGQHSFLQTRQGQNTYIFQLQNTKVASCLRCRTKTSLMWTAILFYLTHFVGRGSGESGRRESEHTEDQASKIIPQMLHVKASTHNQLHETTNIVRSRIFLL